MYLSAHVHPGTLALCLLASAISTSLSCSSTEEKKDGSLEAGEILELINEGQKRNDPKNDVEIDLGKFRVTHAVKTDDEVLLLVDFQLYGVLTKERQASLELALPHFGNRLRDAVVSQVQSIETEHLTDPSLAFFKAELIAAINRVLQDRLIKDVVFGEFSVHDAHHTSFPTTAPAAEVKKKPSGHGH